MTNRPFVETLIVGFDSAWTAENCGAIVAVLQQADGTLVEIGDPQMANFVDAEAVLSEWKKTHSPKWITVLLDQPTIVANPAGQRPVENIVSSSVSLRYGGMQPANTGRSEMFGPRAPVWGFLDRFGGPWNPVTSQETRVIETYPVLALIALGWTLRDSRPTGRLPKYNPERRKTFSLSDWKHVSMQVRDALSSFRLSRLADWADRQVRNASPRKHDQDGLDSCICLLAGLALHSGRECLMIGGTDTGYIVVPESEELRGELTARCHATGRVPSDWVKPIRL